MTKQLKRILKELIWLAGLILIAGAVEYVVIVLFDLHPIFSVKIQGLIGLTVIAYVIRMAARMIDFSQSTQDNDRRD